MANHEREVQVIESSPPRRDDLVVAKYALNALFAGDNINPEITGAVASLQAQMDRALSVYETFEPRKYKLPKKVKLKHIECLEATFNNPKISGTDEERFLTEDEHALLEKEIADKKGYLKQIEASKLQAKIKIPSKAELFPASVAVSIAGVTLVEGDLKKTALDVAAYALFQGVKSLRRRGREKSKRTTRGEKVQTSKVKQKDVAREDRQEVVVSKSDLSRDEQMMEEVLSGERLRRSKEMYQNSRDGHILHHEAKEQRWLQINHKGIPITWHTWYNVLKDLEDKEKRKKLTRKQINSARSHPDHRIQRAADNPNWLSDLSNY